MTPKRIEEIKAWCIYISPEQPCRTNENCGNAVDCLPECIDEIERLQRDYEELENSCSKCGESEHPLPSEKDQEIERLQALVKTAHREGFAAIEGFAAYDADDYLWKNSEAWKALESK